MAGMLFLVKLNKISWYVCRTMYYRYLLVLLHEGHEGHSCAGAEVEDGGEVPPLLRDGLQETDDPAILFSSVEGVHARVGGGAAQAGLVGQVATSPWI